WLGHVIRNARADAVRAPRLDVRSALPARRTDASGRVRLTDPAALAPVVTPFRGVGGSKPSNDGERRRFAVTSRPTGPCGGTPRRARRRPACRRAQPSLVADRRIAAHDHIRPTATDDAREVAAEGDRRLDDAVLVAEKDHLRHAEDASRLA